MLTPESENVAVPPSKVEAHGIDVLPYLLLPLAGPEEFDLEVIASSSIKILPAILILLSGPRQTTRASTIPSCRQDPGTRRGPASDARRDVAVDVPHEMGPRLPAGTWRV